MLNVIRSVVQDIQLSREKERIFEGGGFMAWTAASEQAIQAYGLIAQMATEQGVGDFLVEGIKLRTAQGERPGIKVIKANSEGLPDFWRMANAVEEVLVDGLPEEKLREIVRQVVGDEKSGELVRRRNLQYCKSYIEDDLLEI